MSVKNILVVRLGGIGDVTVVTPALKALKELYPQSRISLMTNRYSAEVARGAPYANELICFTELFSTQSIFEFLKPKILYQLYRLATLMLGRRFDIFICLHNMVSWTGAVKPLVLSVLSRAPIRAGLNTANRGFFLNVKTPDNPDKHLMSRCLDVIKQLASHSRINYTPQQPELEVWLDDKDRAFAGDFAGRNPAGLLVGIHPGGNTRTYATKCWPAERFARVAGAIADKYKARILLTGGKTDRHILDRIIPLLKNPPLLLPENISVKQLAAIIGRCNLFISNDTGPMHLAVAMKVPTIGIFGGGDFSTYGRYPAEMGLVAMKKYPPCSPCYHKIKCEPPECLDKITVEEVLEAVEFQVKRQNTLSYHSCESRNLKPT